MARYMRILSVFFSLPLGAQYAEAQQYPPPPPIAHEQLEPSHGKHESLYLFAKAALCEREDRLLEALATFERAAQLDPQSVAILKELLPLYLKVGRAEQAFETIRRVLALDPHDYQISFLYARQLRSQENLVEASEVLRLGLQSTTLRTRPHAHHQMESEFGIIQERLGKLREAAAAFGRAAAILDDPANALEMANGPGQLSQRSAELHERVGRNLVEAGDHEAAVAAFRLAQIKFPGGAGRIHYHLAQLSLKQGKLADAETSLREYLKLLPQGIDAYELMIGLLAKQNRESEVVPLLEEAMTRDTFNVGLRMLVARYYVQVGQVKKAEATYRALVETAPTEVAYRELLLLYRNHHPQGMEFVTSLVNEILAKAAGPEGLKGGDKAAAQAQALIGALRDSPDLGREVVSTAANPVGRALDLNTLQVLAALADRFDQLPQACYFYRQCLKQPLPAATEPLLYGGALRVLWKTQNYEGIVDVCRTGLTDAKASNRVLLRASLAEALARLDKWDEALREADHAVLEASSSESFRLRMLRGRLLLQAGRFAGAEAECHKLLEEHQLPGEKLEIRYLLAGVYSLSQRIPLAEVQLAECLKIDPDNIAVNNDLGFHWADQGKNLPQAEALIRKAIDLDRKNRQQSLVPSPEPAKEFHDNACYIDSLGWVLFRQGRIDDALRELRYAASLPDGDDPAIWEHLGDVYRASGQVDRARDAWQQAIYFYEHGKRRKIDERYRALQHKLRAAGGK